MIDKYGTVQFYHDQQNDITYAVDVPFTKEDLLECVHHFNQPIQFFVGKSYVHPKDKYCKKVGREVSSKKLVPIEVKLQGVSKDNEKLYLFFGNDDHSLHLKFRVSSYSEKPHFLQANDLSGFQEYF